MKVKLILFARSGFWFDYGTQEDLLKYSDQISLLEKSRKKKMFVGNANTGDLYLVKSK